MEGYRLVRKNLSIWKVAPYFMGSIHNTFEICDASNLPSEGYGDLFELVINCSIDFVNE